MRLTVDWSCAPIKLWRIILRTLLATKSLICPRPGWVNNPLQHRWFLCSCESWEALKLGSSSSPALAGFIKYGIVLSGHVLLLLHPLFVHQTRIRPILGTDSWQRLGWCFRGQLIFADICPRAMPSALSLFGGLRVSITSTATDDRPVIRHLWSLKTLTWDRMQLNPKRSPGFDASTPWIPIPLLTHRPTPFSVSYWQLVPPSTDHASSILLWFCETKNS